MGSAGDALVRLGPARVRSWSNKTGARSAGAPGAASGALPVIIAALASVPAVFLTLLDCPYETVGNVALDPESGEGQHLPPPAGRSHFAEDIAAGTRARDLRRARDLPLEWPRAVARVPVQ
jgi:hypothetical protein